MIVVGQYTGTGANLDIKTIGFAVKSLELRAANGAWGSWTKLMADGSVHKRVTAGTGSLVTGGNGVTPQGKDGFRIGADADLNAAGVVVDYIAVCE